MSIFFLICFPVGKLKYRAVRFKNGRWTAQAIDRKDWRRRIVELWKLAEMYRGDWRRRTENVKAQSEFLKQYLVQECRFGVGMNDIRPVPNMTVGRDSVIGIMTRYKLDGPGIESRWGEIFHTRPDGPEAHQTSNIMGTGSFPGGRWSGPCANHAPHQTTRLKKEWKYAFTVPNMMKINKLQYTAWCLCTPAVLRKQYRVQH